MSNRQPEFLADITPEPVFTNDTVDHENHGRLDGIDFRHDGLTLYVPMQPAGNNPAMVYAEFGYTELAEFIRAAGAFARLLGDPRVAAALAQYQQQAAKLQS